MKSRTVSHVLRHRLFIRWASFFVESFSPIPTKREFPGEEASRIGCLFDYVFFRIVFNAFLIQKRLVRLSRDFGESRVFECNVFSHVVFKDCAFNESAFFNLSRLDGGLCDKGT